MIINDNCIVLFNIFVLMYICKIIIYELLDNFVVFVS